MCEYMFLDDERFPTLEMPKMKIVRSYDEAVAWMSGRKRSPVFVSFDNDLGAGKEGIDVAHWMIEKDLDMEGTWFADGFSFYVHSQNPVQRENIKNLLENYLMWKKLQLSTSE